MSAAECGSLPAHGHFLGGQRGLGRQQWMRGDVSLVGTRETGVWSCRNDSGLASPGWGGGAVCKAPGEVQSRVWWDTSSSGPTDLVPEDFCLQRKSTAGHPSLGLLSIFYLHLSLISISLLLSFLKTPACPH